MPQYAQTPVGEAEIAITGDVSYATAIATPLSIEQQDGGGAVLEVPNTMQIIGRISGSAADSADILVTVWHRNRLTGAWYGPGKLRFVGDDNREEAAGNIKDFVGVIGTDAVAFEVSGILTNQALHLLVYRSAR